MSVKEFDHYVINDEDEHRYIVTGEVDHYVIKMITILIMYNRVKQNDVRYFF